MKKFSSKYINYYNILKYAVIGFEFEFYTKKPYYKLLELLNRELAPIKTWGKRKYHSEMKTDAENFKIEPDLSGGVDLVELITGPLPYIEAKIILLKIMKLMQDNTYTDEKCSIHINISFDKKSGKELIELNPLKLILDIDEELVYKFFPNRKNNFYAKSVKKLIPFKDYKFSTDAMKLVISNIELPDTKYYGVNIKNYTEGRLEFRYIGGTDYHKKTDPILELMDYFILLTWNALDKKLDDNDNEKLLDYLSDNISNFKKFTKYEDFIGEFPTIKIEIDKRGEFATIKSYYDKIYDKLFDIMQNTYNLRDALINFDTDRMRMEIFDSFVKGIFDIKYLDFIDCQISEGTYFKCSFQDCDIKNSHIEDCKIENSEVFNCKLTNCHIDQESTLEKVYFYGGFLDGKMESGIFRGGVIGPNAVIGDGVKMVTDDDNYFGTSLAGSVSKKEDTVKSKKGTKNNLI